MKLKNFLENTISCNIFKFFVLFISFFMLITLTSAKNENNIYLFYGKECPHCEGEMKVLNSLLSKDKYKSFKLNKFEVWHNKNNAELFYEVQDFMKKPSNGVPYLIIGTNVLIGYSNITEKQIDTLLNNYNDKKYYDPAGDYIFKKDTSANKDYYYDFENEKYEVPILGNIDAKNTSLFLVSIVMGFIDGFNPCAMWILLFLLTLLISTKDRKKMWILGSVFILSSSLVYLFFMLSWLNLAKATSKIIFVRYLLAVFALIFGLVNIYRYIKQRKNSDVGCDVTGAEKRRKIITKIKNIISNNNYLFAIIGIILLAVSVNLIELLCSLGMPVMFTEILSINNLSSFKYLMFVLIYVLFFMLDDLIIFAIAMKTLKVKGISNKYMKYSHLIGGTIMFIIGLLLLLRPEWLMFNF